jgi:2-hydroxy-3-oxopropionate reductase
MIGTTRSQAFSGTGLIGAPMGRQLLRSGLAVTVWSSDSAKAEDEDARSGGQA